MKGRWTINLGIGLSIGCLVFLNSCAPALQIGASLAGESVASLMDSSNTSIPGSESEKNRIRYYGKGSDPKFKFEKCNVRFRNLKKNRLRNIAVFYLVDEEDYLLNENLEYGEGGAIIYEESDEDKKAIAEFKAMSLDEKKQYIRDTFHEFGMEIGEPVEDLD